MIDERCLKLDIYEYLKYCKQFYDIKVVGVITDKQYIFYSQVLKDKYGTHYDIQSIIENAIYTNNITDEYIIASHNNVYFYTMGPEAFIISLPENGELSKSQLNFLVHALDQIEKYNKEQEIGNKKVKLTFYNTRKNRLIKEAEGDITKLKEELKKIVTQKVILEEEQIIGKTLGKEDIKNNLIFYIGLENCRNILELNNAIEKCINYYKDNYYKDIFSEIFPNYTRVSKLMDVIRHLGFQEKEIESITFKNIEDILCNIIRSAFCDIKTFDEMLKISNDMNSIVEKDQIDKIFPNFSLFLSFCHVIKPMNDEEKNFINEQIKKASSYEEIAKIVFRIGYEKKMKKANELSDLLSSYEEKLEKNWINKNIITHKDELKEIIVQISRMNEELKLHESKLQNIEKRISSEEAIIINHNKELSHNTTNVFRKIFRGKKIRTCISNIKTSETQKRQLESERESLIIGINSLKEQIRTLEVRIKDITKTNTVPKSVTEVQELCDKVVLIDENEIIRNIDLCKKEIMQIKSELEIVKKLGLVVINPEYIQEDGVKNSNISPSYKN